MNLFDLLQIALYRALAKQLKSHFNSVYRRVIFLIAIVHLESLKIQTVIIEIYN